MKPEDQEAIKTFYNSMKDLAKAFEQLDRDLEGINNNHHLRRVLSETIDSKPSTREYLKQQISNDTIYSQ